MKRSRARRRLEQKKEKPAKKTNWYKYALLPAGLALGIAAYHGIKRDTPKRDAVSDSAGIEKRPRQKNRFGIPPHKITITDTKLAPADAKSGLKLLDSEVSSFLEKTSSALCPLTFGPRSGLDERLARLKNALVAKGFTQFSDAATGQDVLERLYGFYLKNNIWMMLRTSTKRDPKTRTVELVTCLNRFPIKSKAALSFSLFEGRLSASGIPVYVLGGEVYESRTLMGGVATGKGVIVFPDALGKSPKRDRLLSDIILHEGVHYNTIRKQGGWDFHDVVDFDADAMKKEPLSRTLSRAKDELRAHLIQIIYGKEPRNCLAGLWKSSIPQHQMAVRVVSDTLKNYLRKNDPVRYRLFIGRRLHSGMIREDEMRQMSYDAFIEYKLWKL